MKIGILMILLGGITLFYKNEGFYGFGGYVDKSFENIIISSVFIVVGFIFMKKSKTFN
jgi:hypothetical protein